MNEQPTKHKKLHIEQVLPVNVNVFLHFPFLLQSELSPLPLGILVNSVILTSKLSTITQNTSYVASVVFSLG